MTGQTRYWKARLLQWLPSREALAAHPWLRPLVARGVAVGTWWAFVLPFGQIVVATAHCTLWRANIPVAAAMTMVTNPLTIGFWLWLAYQLGAWILGSARLPLPSIVLPGSICNLYLLRSAGPPCLAWPCSQAAARPWAMWGSNCSGVCGSGCGAGSIPGHHVLRAMVSAHDVVCTAMRLLQPLCKFKEEPLCREKTQEVSGMPESPWTAWSLGLEAAQAQQNFTLRHRHGAQITHCA